ncbi:hypothetical protein BDV29DRAFT_193072 [Aspergillus leporis]|uniref:Rhodopsin domain-containing protein n=1 Tax=Aspergillus leporis TaxID=41062 RepID=A0A5N5WTB7_9EURO|nr:hypothetical protein BDV29DRAFT_193072 [Aspergillus leporis]
MRFSSDAPAPQGAATQLSANGLISITWVGVALGIAFTAARVAIRLRKMKRLLVDDRFVLFALGLLILNATLQTIQAPRPYYMALTPTAEDIKYHTLRYVHLEFAHLAVFWKIPDGLPRNRHACCGIAIFAFLAYTGCWLASASTCAPLSNYFKLGQCSKPIDIKGSVIPICYSTTVDIVTDLMSTTIAPEDKWLRNNNYLVIHQNVGLVIVFCVGFIIIATAIIRAIEIPGRAYSDQIGLAIWCITESSISVIVGCLSRFKYFISQKPSTTLYLYGSSGYMASRQDRSQASARIKRFLVTASSSQIPLEDMKSYRNLEYESHARDVHDTGGIGMQAVPRNTSWSKMSEKEPRVKIRIEISNGS